jgi:flagellar motor switch/type III secretory pathway protein FliN
MTATHNVIDIYIPRMLGYVSSNTIHDAFINLNIGKVNKLDMHKKTNEHGYKYYFAFIQLELFDTPESKRLADFLALKGVMHLVYDEEACQYWEVKQHIPKAMRYKKTENNNIKSQLKNPSRMLNDIKNQVESFVSHTTLTVSGITQQDRLDMIEEYEDLQREIFQLVC